MSKFGLGGGTHTKLRTPIAGGVANMKRPGQRQMAFSLSLPPVSCFFFHHHSIVASSPQCPRAEAPSAHLVSGNEPVKTIIPTRQFLSPVPPPHGSSRNTHHRIERTCLRERRGFLLNFLVLITTAPSLMVAFPLDYRYLHAQSKRLLLRR